MLRRLVSRLCDNHMNGEKAKSDATALSLVRVLKRCPICKSAFTAHHYASFATTVLGEGGTPRVVGFLQSIKEHRWADLQSFQDWDSSSDALEALAVRCPTGEIGLAIMRNPQEFWDSDQLVDLEVLTIADSRQLEALLEQDRWRPIK